MTNKTKKQEKQTAAKKAGKKPNKSASKIATPQPGSWQSQDPNYEREMRKYGKASPSREFLSQVLEDAGSPLGYDELAERLNMTVEEELKGLKYRLGAMVRDGQLVQTRRGGFAPTEALDLVKGRVVGHREGFGFLVPDEGGDDLFLGPRAMRLLMHGDRAVCRMIGLDQRGRKEGSLVEILERAHKEVVGRFYFESGVGFVQPDNSRLTKDLIVPGDWRGEAEHGEIVVAEIVEYPNKRVPCIGRVQKVLGQERAPGMEIDIAMRSHGIPFEWPAAVEDAAAKLGKTVTAAAKKGRVDYRETPLITIDGADSKDFDDAVYCERDGDGWRLLVAIADVSHYVKPGTPFDLEAAERGNSVYFPQQVIPMLPEVLSNGLCSLNPNVDRLCMVCEMTINKDGEVVSHTFHEGLMRSHARCTYDQVGLLLGCLPEATPKPRVTPKIRALLPQMEELYSLYKTMRKARTNRGAIDFDTVESCIIFDDERKIDRIEAIVRHDAHKIIEECMIAANVASARFLAKHKMPTLYRVHGGPKTSGLETLREFLQARGLSLGGGERPSPSDYARVMKQSAERQDKELVQTVLLRSLQQAVYSPDNEKAGGSKAKGESGGHFGLSLAEYLHFTSPIRRYPDLQVHRGIRHILQGGTAENFDFTTPEMASCGEQCSMTERRADEAVRDATAWLKCEYMQDKVGEEFTGKITGVTSFGVFVALDDVHIEGLVHVTSLPGDYYHYDDMGHKLVGERSGKEYRLSDRVEIKVVRVDLDERKIDFEPVVADDGLSSEPKKPARKRRRKKSKDTSKKS